MSENSTTCKVCGEALTKRQVREGSRFCSRACVHPPKALRFCVICKEVLRIDQRNCCSNECRSIWQTKAPRPCPECGGDIEGLAKYCSTTCVASARKLRNPLPLCKECSAECPTRGHTYCSDKCLKAYRLRNRKGRYNVEGYIFLYKPDYHRANSNHCVLEHIVVMEKKLRRKLKKEEVVHHINGIRDDNRPENLQVFPTNTAHSQYHADRNRQANKLLREYENRNSRGENTTPS